MGKRTLWTISTHLGSMLLTRVLWISTIILHLDSYVVGANHIILKIGTIQSGVVLPRFFGGNILYRERIYWHI